MPDRWQIRGLHLAILAGFAVSQPLFDVLQRHPTFLVSHRVAPGDLALLTVILGLSAPAMLFLPGALSCLLPRRAGALVYSVFFAVLVAASVLPPLHGAPMGGLLAVVVALIVGAAVTLVYARSVSLRRYFSWGVLGLLVFPIWFLASPGVRSLLIRGEAAESTSLEIEDNTPVVLLILDEFPTVSILGEDRGIDPVRYPHFAALAADAHWFRNASTVASFTEQAAPAILTGTYPDGDLLPIHDHYPDNLFSLLGGAYAMHVHESVTMLLPPELQPDEAPPPRAEMGAMLSDLRVIYLHVLLPAEFTGGLPSISGNWRDFGGAPAAADAGPQDREQLEQQLMDLDQVARQSRVEDAIDFIDGISPEDPRTLYVLHTLLPHSKWEHTPSGRNYCRDCPPRPGLVDNVWSEDGRYAQYGYQRHLMQVQLADRLLGRLVDQLRQTGLYDKALLVVTADHGASFWPGTPFRHLENNPNPADILDVPLFIKLPGQDEGVVTDRHVQTIDIVPTILDQLGVEVPEDMDGSSVFDPAYLPAPFKRARDSEGDFRDYDADPQLKFASLDRMVSLFGSGSEGSIYAMREHQPLLGQPIAEFEVEADSPWYLSTDWTYFRDAKKFGAFTPVYVRGAIDGEGAHEALSVIAVVDGEIAAVGRAIQTSATRARFYMLLPEDVLEPGQVQLQLLVLDESGSVPRIMDGHTYPLEFTALPLPPRFLED